VPSGVQLPAAGCAFSLLLALDAFPKAFNLLRRERALISEYMRMATDELRRNSLDHAAEVECTLLLCHASMKHDLKEQIAKLFAQIL
jgi:hypothetical protein